MALITEEMKAKADQFYEGDEICQEKSKFLLQEVALPRGLLPLKDIIECGYVEETGFVWLKQKQKVEHVFEKIGRKVSYAPVITAYVEQSKIKKLTGVKAKELLIWLTLDEITAVDDSKITFKTSAGLYKTFPRSAFELEEDDEKKQQKVAPQAPEQASQVVSNN
ncbi:hypothetical protein Cni_G03846 [Canna indica]|uniref:Uncharacterized protein n=1 Tax=Canna indica TaxID=4628 RepID=A0AAQ3Q3W8_9LILI|nr:hypothetical protein Cni_G03846 [Canna indica]